MFYIIIFINIFLYALRFIVGQNYLVKNFALYPSNEIFTFFTCNFIHSDFEHLCMNMVMLFMIMQILKYFNKSHLLIIYLAGGIFSSFAYYFTMTSLGYYNFILLGASGAISALFGFASIVLRQPGFLIAIAISSIISIIFFHNVAWQAHIFGAIFGIIYAYILRFRLF